MVEEELWQRRRLTWGRAICLPLFGEPIAKFEAEFWGSGSDQFFYSCASVESSLVTQDIVKAPPLPITRTPVLPIHTVGLAELP